MFGDSIQARTDPDGLGPLLQAALDKKFSGVTVTVLAKHGATAADLTSQGQPTGLTSVGVGANDAANGVPVEAYKTSLRNFAPGASLILQTPGPMDTSKPYTADDAAYAQAVRDVAKERGAMLIDVQSYVLSLPNWQVLYPDGTHPSDALNRMLVADVIAPAVSQAVAPLRCQ